VKKTACFVAALACLCLPAFAQTTYYVRPDGGTRYSTNVTTGLCDGKGDSAPVGTAPKQRCAFGDVRYLWQDGSYTDSTTFPGWGWVIAGGDTVIIRGGPWRVGWATNTNSCGTGGCFGIAGNPYASGAPNPPSGTAAGHTRILGEHFAACSTGNVPNLSAMTEIFGGFAVGSVVSMGSPYVDFQCIKVTDHSSCTKSGGANAYPSGCATNAPLDDFASNGIQTGTGTSNVLFQDVYVHGLVGAGFSGPIGGPVTLTRVISNFNAFAGWNFDNGVDTPDGPGSSLTLNYLTMVGNGCNEEYPIVHTAFPAASCYDLSSGGFGDALSGQDTELDALTCNHCDFHWNTKDGFIGPHTKIKNLTITQSTSYGNMGQQWKWNTTTGATVIFTNNYAGNNCFRQSQALPGAVSSFWMGSNNPGAFLSAACRASGDAFNVQTDAGSTNLFAGNTIMGVSNVAIDFGCGEPNNCTGVPITFTDNVFLGYFDSNYSSHLPTPYYTASDATLAISSDHNLYYNINGPCPTGVGEVCVSPQLAGQPASPFSAESDLDAFNFNPASGSPLIGAGVPLPSLSVDYYGAARSPSPTIGAVEVASSTAQPPPPPPPPPPPTSTWFFATPQIVDGSVVTFTSTATVRYGQDASTCLASFMSCVAGQPSPACWLPSVTITATTIAVGTAWAGSDPCPGVMKQLEIQQVASVQTVKMVSNGVTSTVTVPALAGTAPPPPPPVPVAPTITWSNPASIVSGTALSSTQMNATASTPGTFVYTPALGTVMATAGTANLSVAFTPTDTVHFTSATGSASLLVTAPVVLPKAFTFTKTFTCTPAASGSTVVWTCK
jgi:hypothetical protein